MLQELRVENYNCRSGLLEKLLPTYRKRRNHEMWKLVEGSALHKSRFLHQYGLVKRMPERRLPKWISDCYTLSRKSKRKTSFRVGNVHVSDDKDRELHAEDWEKIETEFGSREPITGKAEEKKYLTVDISRKSCSQQQCSFNVLN